MRTNDSVTKEGNNQMTRILIREKKKQSHFEVFLETFKTLKIFFMQMICHFKSVGSKVFFVKAILHSVPVHKFKIFLTKFLYIILPKNYRSVKNALSKIQ